MPVDTIKFRNLTAEEVEVRRGHKVGNTGKVELLIYKTARTDMQILNETVGCFGWKKYYKPVNGMTVCCIAIKNKSTGEWVEKEDVGAEQNFEKEKSLASDSMKRAGFNWGIGVNLYTAPRVVITPENDYATYRVQEIGYGEKNEIKDLVIVDNNENVVFNYRNGQVEKLPEIDRQEVLKAVCGELKGAGEDKSQLLKFFNYYQERCEGFDGWNAGIVRKLWNKWKGRAK